MACLNPDGTLTRSARALLGAVADPAGEQQLIERTSLPRFQVRSLLRDMTTAKLLREHDGVFELTEDGRDLLATVT